MKVELIKVVMDEIRTIIEELDYRIDKMYTSELVHPKYKFYNQMDLNNLLSTRRRIYTLRESFIGRMMLEVQNETDVPVEQAFRACAEEVMKEGDVACNRHWEMNAEVLHSHQLDKMIDNKDATEIIKETCNELREKLG